MGIKSGFLTSEFWGAMIPHVLAILVISGVLSQEESIEIGELALDGVDKWFALIASALSAWGYAKSRAQVKSNS